MADEGQMRQLTWNLIRNAVQASTSGGEVRVRVSAGQNVQLVVEDDGVGIDAAAKKMMFDEFFTTRTHGTGLGLAVVKRIADEHGIVLKVESEENEGAQFSADFGPELPDEEQA
jgi:signal transduction histidine kinase